MGVTMSWFSVLKSLLVVCIFTNLSISSVESYGCVAKTCYNGRCSSNSKPCESFKGCFYEQQEFEAPTPFPSQKAQEKGCSKDKCTELAFSATLGSHQTFKYDRGCCYTDQCNKEVTQVSSPSSQPNGVECPACYSEDDVCKPISLKCTGEETKCVEVIGRETIQNTVIHGMGCATKTACNLKNMTIMYTTKINTYCTNGSPPLWPI